MHYWNPEICRQPVLYRLLADGKELTHGKNTICHVWVLCRLPADGKEPQGRRQRGRVGPMPAVSEIRGLCRPRAFAVSRTALCRLPYVPLPSGGGRQRGLPITAVTPHLAHCLSLSLSHPDHSHPCRRDPLPAASLPPRRAHTPRRPPSRGDPPPAPCRAPPPAAAPCRRRPLRRAPSRAPPCRQRPLPPPPAGEFFLFLFLKKLITLVSLLG